jgi:hypothetical protein
MPSTNTDRLGGLSTSVAIKAPVQAIAIVPITLSGEQTISTVPCVSGDRVLLTAQTNAVDNGIWEVSTGSWTRTQDFDGNRDIVSGTMVIGPVASGASGAIWQLVSPNPLTIGTSELIWDEFTLSAAAPPPAAGSTFPINAAETAAGVTVVDEGIPWGWITRYGAVANDSTVGSNDTAIQAAIKVASISGGGMVYIPSALKYYGISNEFPMSGVSMDGITIRGEGVSSQIRQTSASALNIFNLGNNTAIENVYLRGSSAASYGATFEKFNGIYASGVRGIRVSDCYISHYTSAGIQIRDCANYRIEGNTIFQGIVVAATNSTQSDILVYSLTAGARGVITKNQCFSNVRAAGIATDMIGYDYDLVITDNIVITLNASWAQESQVNVTRRHGIQISYQASGTSGGRIVCNGNVVGNCTTTGICRESGVDPVYPCLISDNFINNVGWDTYDPSLCGGIYLNRGGAGDKVCDNIITDFRGAAGAGAGGSICVNVAGSITTDPCYVTIENNQCITSTKYGINLSGNIRNTLIQGNRIAGCTLGAMYIVYNPAGGAYQGNNTIQNNDITSIGTVPGIFLDTGSAAGATHILRNTIMGADNATANGFKNAGVYLPTATNHLVYIRENTITSHFYGVFTYSIPAGRGSLPNIVRNNIISCYRGIGAVGTTAEDVLACVQNSYRSLTDVSVAGQAYNIVYTENANYVLTGNDVPKDAGNQVGTWILGDKVMNSSPVPGGYAGWICTTGGSGAGVVWKTFGPISA